ncbi:MAG: glycine cleavage system protein GcvH [Candidatus Makaraimicrobium thalassicum]|nr:MAG: glycine cleavage system protein GcvH [Candidatus Omnitrophota bacterium]
MVPQELKYTKEHEWVRIEGGEAVFGITDHAQSELGDVTFVEFPDTGSEIKQFGSLATVESVKAASDIYAPLSGRILKVNEALRDKPEIINQSPYEEGWICRISVADAMEERNLMDASAYETYLKESG